MNIFKKIFGTTSEKELKRLAPIADRIEALEPEYQKKSDAELRAKTDEFKARLKKGETLDDILPEAFATVREAAIRAHGQRAFHVQLIGGIVLHQGRIAEMKTGEGKTLTAVFPSYLNALTGEGVHIVTVNDYLASYQSELMGRIHAFLGVSVGCIVHGLTNDQRREAYACDITYGTNNEFGFDYLRDNMAIYKEQMVQRGHRFAIVDELDSILIDEARTPLIISGEGDKSTELYGVCDRLAASMKKATVKELDAKSHNEEIDGDYVVDEKARTVTLTPDGVEKAEKYFNIENLSDPENALLHHHVNQAIRARGLMKRDIDYVVRDGEVIIVDEFTGRLMIGRRYSEGLHQAIEAKENVSVQKESKTLATITFQNYFRMYKKLSGMTGTAMTEQDEFNEIYSLDIVEIPTNEPMIRADHADAVYLSEAGKFRAIIQQIEACHAKSQPVLVGTISIEKSEHISNLLKKTRIKHEVLNAKHHEKEAEIVAQAGRPGTVTIATNMAGRGTDIMLGGNAEFLAKKEMMKEGFDKELVDAATSLKLDLSEEEAAARARYKELHTKFKAECTDLAKEVIAAGGLFILGTERHESRRIDNQLRGRSGRQGDPGESRFYISLEDDLMRLFGSERVTSMVRGLGFGEDTPIEHKMLSGAIETAQRRLESRNFETRKHVLQYDDVMNKQREIIYGQRSSVLEGEDLKGFIEKIMDDVIDGHCRHCFGENRYAEKHIIGAINEKFGFLAKGGLKYKTSELDKITVDHVVDTLTSAAQELYKSKEAEFTPQRMRELERVVLLKTVDKYWIDHIDAMHELRQGIGLRAYAQTDPVAEYKREGFEMFDEMVAAIREDTMMLLLSARIRTDDELKRTQVAKPAINIGGDGKAAKPPQAKSNKTGRNDLCPCGSGKKYKKCCGA